MNSDIIGGFPIINPNCQGCNKPLELDNAWMTDGCPCNSSLGCNNQNETRWRLLMQLQQGQSHRITALEAENATLRQQLASFEAEHYNEQIDLHGVNQK